jgi:uncharacterized protein YecE (DUF72 family)
MWSTTFPQVITHEKVLVDCEEDLKHFLKTMDAMHEKLGPLLFQFGYFNNTKFKSGRDFLARLAPFLKTLPKSYKIAVEIRNKYWLDARFVDTLRENGVALALIDQSWVPRPWEIKAKSDHRGLYLCSVAGRPQRNRGTDEDVEKTIVDRRPEMERWVELFREFIARNMKIFAFANNHYALCRRRHNANNAAFRIMPN